MSELITQLHNLAGSTLGETLRSWNQFIKTLNEEVKANLTFILLNFHPKNDLEKLIRIRIIDHYRCHDEILNILKSEDTFYISHALQCSWFFSSFNFEPHLLVESVFPHMSFTTRLKVLKKYSKQLKNTKAAEALFEHLKVRYGLNNAYALLPACSECFIKEALEKSSVRIPVCIMTPLFHLYPSVVISYLTFLLECHSTKRRVFRTFDLCIYERIFVLIAAREPLKFATLMEKYHPSIPYLKLGKRATKTFVHAAFESLKSHVMIYKRILVWKYVVSSLSLDQVASLQLAQFPSTANEFMNHNWELEEITDGLETRIKQEILMNNFNKAYGKPIIDYLEAFDFNLVKTLPRSITEKWIEKNLLSIENQYHRGDRVMYFPKDKAILLLKKMIESQSDANIRAHFVECLFSVIEINDDISLVGPLCEYAVTRLRNDRSMIKETIITQLALCKNIINISDESWTAIEKLCNIMFLNNEVNTCLHNIIKLMSIQIHSRLKRELPVIEHLDKILKVSNSYYEFDVCINTPYQKQCLVLFVDRFPEKRPADLKKNEEPISIVKLFSRLCVWNGLHPFDRIDIPSWMMEHIINMFMNEDSYHYSKSIVLSAVRKDKVLKYKFYDQVFPHFFDPFILLYKLSSEPLKIKENYADILKKVLNQVMTQYNLFFRKARLYTPLGIPKLLSDYCLTVFQEKNADDDYSGQTSLKNSIIVLSLLLPTNEFVEIISDYYPKQNTTDDYSDEGRNIFEIQKQITACFKLVNCPSAILDSVSKFAVGDYLKLVVGSINSICLRSPEIKILPLLIAKLDSPVSARKHIVRAYFKIAPVQRTLEMIVKAIENENNPSIRFVLFDHSFKFFISEPSSETFGVLKAVVAKLQPSDEAAITRLFDIENVPNEFISDYLQLLWDVISLKNEAQVKNNRNKIINLIEPDILRLLNETLCDDLIPQVFSHGELCKPDVNMDLNLFIVRYLLYSQNSDQLNHRIEKIMVEIGNLVSKWNDYDLKTDCVFASRNIVCFITDSLVNESFSIHKKVLSPADVMAKFKTSLFSYLKEDDILEELLSLDMAIFFHSTPNNSELMFHFSNFLGPIADNIVLKYGSAIIYSVWAPLIKLFKAKYTMLDIYQKYMLELSQFLFHRPSIPCKLISLEILPSTIITNTEQYKQIVDTIFQTPDPTLKVYANRFFRGLSSSVRVE